MKGEEEERGSGSLGLGCVVIIMFMKISQNLAGTKAEQDTREYWAPVQKDRFTADYNQLGMKLITEGKYQGISKGMKQEQYSQYNYRKPCDTLISCSRRC